MVMDHLNGEKGNLLQTIGTSYLLNKTLNNVGKNKNGSKVGACPQPSCPPPHHVFLQPCIYTFNI